MRIRPVPTPPPRARRPSLADVARAARVSLMTASYALRNNPKISAPTRKRVQQAARKVGYVPHPEIGRLMHLLRAGRLPSFQSTLAFLTTADGAATASRHPYTLGVIAGARQRAERLGYAVDEVAVDRTDTSPHRLTTMLVSRGIRGVLLPPLSAVHDCSTWLDWSQFAIVAATYSAQNLDVNRVVPHHLRNIQLAIARLTQAGRRRLGLVLTADLVQRANSAYQAALALHQQQSGGRPIPPLALDASEPGRSASLIGPWLRRHRPDALVTVTNAVPLLGGASRGGDAPVLCLLDHPGTGPLAGVHQVPRIIGETAIDLLAGQVQRGEFGFQDHARFTMVEGLWHPGPLVAEQAER